jgi:hypothetical protein
LKIVTPTAADEKLITQAAVILFEGLVVDYFEAFRLMVSLAVLGE